MQDESGTESDIMANPTGVGGNALLSTLINHVASREGEIETAELDMIFGIVASLAGRISPDAMQMATAKLSALTAFQSTQPVVQHMAHDEPVANGMEPHQAQEMALDQVSARDLSAHSMAAPVLFADDRPQQHYSSEPATAAHADNMIEATMGDDEYTVAFTDMLDQPHLHEDKVYHLAQAEAAVAHCAILPAISAAEALAKAATCGPAELVMLASLPSPSAQLCNLIVARGNPEALAIMARNPAASFAKSSLTTMVELAASDLSIREALCTRADLGDMILDRLWPYLSCVSKTAVLAMGCRESFAEARILCGETGEDDSASADDDSKSVAQWSAAIEAREATLCNAMRGLDAEGRIADVAMVLAARAGVSPEIALALLLGRYDRGAVVLARLAACDDESLASLIHVRGRAGARSTADKRGPLHAFGRMGEDEARQILGGMNGIFAAAQMPRVFSASPQEPLAAIAA